MKLFFIGLSTGLVGGGLLTYLFVYKIIDRVRKVLNTVHSAVINFEEKLKK